MQNQRILIVDDESSLRTSLFRVLDRKGFQVITANCKKEAEAFCLSQQAFDFALIDLNLPDGNGFDLVERLKIQNPKIKIVIITGCGSIDMAVKATKAGVQDFLTKPFDMEKILLAVDQNLSLTSNLQKKQTGYGLDAIIGSSIQIQNIIKFIKTVADSDSTILVSGESGTGKELVAKAIHYNSNRSQQPFVPVNCGAIPRELLESELFGHVKGAFTGAIANRMGRFELAGEGTIFLDEIGDMNPSLQVKLLRVLQEKSFEPVGATKTVVAKARVISATNIDLEAAVERGQFREDLFYRLNIIPIHVPSLRERPSDIPLLIQHCIEKFNRTKGKNITGVSSEALQILTNYGWPGNVRELENLVERVTILKGQGIIEIPDLPQRYLKVHSENTEIVENENLNIPEKGMDFNTAVDSYENSLIMGALEKTGWNRNQAAILLRLNRTTLVEKIKKKGLRPPDEDIEI
ncbi:MAG: sigma-54 dependent transcriptional regulator [Pseudomonadota bacterium]|nr:sigma-54 dependent transcriptional regulator [Pseudomonadota bacterium]